MRQINLKFKERKNGLWKGQFWIWTIVWLIFVIIAIIKTIRMNKLDKEIREIEKIISRQEKNEQQYLRSFKSRN